MKAIICNSRNPDLVMYFEKKVRAFRKDVIFLANQEIAEDLDIGVSSFSKKPGISLLFFIDALYSVFVLVKLLKNKVNTLVYDTAHISNLPLAFLCKLFRIKLVFTIHDWHPHEGKQANAVLLYNRIVKKYLADEFIVFSPVESTKKVHCLRLAGFDYQGSKGKGGYFLFFGRIEPYKGLRHILNFSKQLMIADRKEKIIIAGKGDDPALTELHSLPNVEIINRFITGEELDDLIGHCIATILPYDTATQSGVTILSYSYEKPVIAFDVGALSYYIEDGFTGYIVEHGNTKKFVDRMISVSNNYSYFSENTSRAFSQYDSNSLVNQYFVLIHNL